MRPEPLAETEKVTEFPSHLVELEGLLVITGKVLTVREAAEEVTEEPHVPLIVTS